jgi:hypothetical protein
VIEWQNLEEEANLECQVEALNHIPKSIFVTYSGIGVLYFHSYG